MNIFKKPEKQNINWLDNVSVVVKFIKNNMTIILLIKFIIFIFSIFLFSKYFEYYFFVWYNNFFNIPNEFINIGNNTSYVLTYDLIKKVTATFLGYYILIYLLIKIYTLGDKNSKLLFFLFYLSPILLVLTEFYYINWNLLLKKSSTDLLLLSYLILFIYTLFHHKEKIDYTLKHKWLNYFIIWFIFFYSFIHSHNLVISYWKDFALKYSLTNNYLNFDYMNNKYIVFWWDDNHFLTKIVSNNKISDGVFLINLRDIEWIEIKKWWVNVNLDKK